MPNRASETVPEHDFVPHTTRDGRGIFCETTFFVRVYRHVAVVVVVRDRLHLRGKSPRRS
eukprot:scaffold8602_cov196-Amphora_coffeaeformis.AAC.24